MKVSVDGGSLLPLGNKRYGTNIFSGNLVSALSLHDRLNKYFIYTFKKNPPKFCWMNLRIPLEEMIKKKDIFLALNQAIPWYVAPKVICFSHGLSYYYYSQYYPKSSYYRLIRQLREMVEKADFIILSSEKIRQEMISIYPDSKDRLVVLPFGIPEDMRREKYMKKEKRDKSILFVANNQKIKNIDLAIRAFSKANLHQDGYRLCLAGDWKKYENKKKSIYSLGNISRRELKKKYRKSACLLTTSYYESFNLPVLEALSQDCPVIGMAGAIVPELAPYAKQANDENDLVTILSSRRYRKSINYNKLKRDFSWKKYAEKLIELY